MSNQSEKNRQEVRQRTIKRCRERKIVIPTFNQMRHPETIPESIQSKLPGLGLWDINPLNLFRISWKNDLSTGRFGKVNYVEIPSSISGVRARIVGIVGKYFPTGAHKVGAAFGCLVPRLVSGEFDPEHQKAVWPSTGNYCRGGAFDCALLGCQPIAILPQEMSRERFEWLHEIGAEVIATPGCESNVKEIYDKCNELKDDPQYVIFNQFAEFGNPMFHYNVTGPAIDEVYRTLSADRSRLAAYISATGSAGTIAAGDYLKHQFGDVKIIATEALQCPTLLMNGFGGHRIEGIGDKHIPWVHNVRNTDGIAAIDDEDCMRILRLFNEPVAKPYLTKLGIDDSSLDRLSLLGISSICNLLAAIKTARYYEMDENDFIFTVFTDSADMYRSRLPELTTELGSYTPVAAAQDHAASLLHQRIDFFKELSYYDRKAIHNLKYYTWIEQQGKTSEELNEQWHQEYWRERIVNAVTAVDADIAAFNAEVNLS